MSIQRIEHPGCRSYGFQARWPDPVEPGRRWTRFFADDAHGGEDQARGLAAAEEAEMRRWAAELRQRLGPTAA